MWVPKKRFWILATICLSAGICFYWIAFSALFGPKVYNQRTLTDKRGGFLVRFDGEDALPIDGYNVIPANATYYLFIPSTYDGTQPYGLVAFINSTNKVSMPKGWPRVLQKSRLIYLSAKDVGNDKNASCRVATTIAGIAKLQSLYHIDPNRIYVAGFSGGGRVAAIAAFHHPDLISGAICDCGVDFYRSVPRFQSTETGAYGVFSCDAQQIEETKKRGRFAIITGSGDFRRGNILDIFNGGFVKDGFKARLWDIPGTDHQYCSDQVLEQAIAYLGQSDSH